MSEPISPETLSRIDKLFMDQRATSPLESQQHRAQHGLDLRVGSDVAASYGLQLALLTAINLGVKCFGGRATAHADATVWLSPCLVPNGTATTLGDAVVALGGTAALAETLSSTGRHLLIGDVVAAKGSVRVTYDGWCAAVGPAEDLARMNERGYCPLAAIAASALGVGEVFAAFAGLNVAATRQVLTLSLWRPDLPIDDPAALGEPILEVPTAASVFGLGHLGQANLWALASLPFAKVGDVTIWLCDDDRVEPVNVETGALLTSAAVDQLKTRTAAAWLEGRGFKTRLLECRVDQNFHRTEREPVLALAGFDDNHARHWLADAGFTLVLDSGLGGEAENFDTIAFRRWPNPRSAVELWPIETAEEREVRKARLRHNVETNTACTELNADECGRLRLAGVSVAVPFVGAVSACLVLAEALKTTNGGPTFCELKI